MEGHHHLGLGASPVAWDNVGVQASPPIAIHDETRAKPLLNGHAYWPISQRSRVDLRRGFLRFVLLAVLSLKKQ